MKYDIMIDYVDASSEGKTAKMTINDENGNSLLRNVPISLPTEMFDVNKAPSYFGMNNSQLLVKKINFKDLSFIDDFYDNEKFSHIKTFNSEDLEGNRKYFDDKNINYIIHKRNILFFPQRDQETLGKDRVAFIVHSSDFLTLSKILSDPNSEISFVVKKKKFSLFAGFENRDESKLSDINSAYKLRNELMQKKHTSTAGNSAQVQERLKKASKEILSGLKKPESLIKDEPEENKKLADPIVSSNKEKSVHNINEAVGKYIINESNNTSSDNENLLFLKSSDPFVNTLIKSGLEQDKNDRLLPLSFLPSFYSYFAIQKFTVEEGSILPALKSMPEGKEIKNVSFLSNENGFYVQMFSDQEKQKPLASITFDYESKKMSLKNENSHISLSPNDKNIKKLLLIQANYGGVKIIGDMLTQGSTSQLVNGEVTSNDSFINYNFYTDGKVSDINNVLALSYNFIDHGPNIMPKLETKVFNLEGNNSLHNQFRDHIDHMTHYLNFEDFKFQGENIELFKKNQQEINLSFSETYLDEVSPTSKVIQHNTQNNSTENKTEEAMLFEGELPTATNNISPFPKNYVRVMQDSDFDDEIDRTIGVDIINIKKRFLEKDPNLAAIDIAALEYEYLFKPYKEERLESEKQSIEDKEIARQKQFIENFLMADIPTQIDGLMNASEEDRKSFFMTTEDPLIKIIYEQSNETKLEILSTYSEEKRKEVFDGVDILENIIKDSNFSDDKIKEILSDSPEKINNIQRFREENKQNENELKIEEPIITVSSEEDIPKINANNKDETSIINQNTEKESIENDSNTESNNNEKNSHLENQIASNGENIEEHKNNEQSNSIKTGNWASEEEQHFVDFSAEMFSQEDHSHIDLSPPDWLQNGNIEDVMPPQWNEPSPENIDYESFGWSSQTISDQDIHTPQSFENSYSENSEEMINSRTQNNDHKVEERVEKKVIPAEVAEKKKKFTPK